ncbi:hypothetical protein MRX96_028858 [Rhipicephalus microplus]
MSKPTTMQDVASEDTAIQPSSPGWEVRARDDGDFDSSLIDIMDLSLHELEELHLLPELDDKGPLAPANSLESLIEVSHVAPSDETTVIEKWKTSFCSLQKAADHQKTVHNRGQCSSTVSASGEDETKCPS